MTTWEPPQDDLIMKLWREGEPASKIAERFPGKSRSAIIGRVHRLRARGVDLPERPTRQPKKARLPRLPGLPQRPRPPRLRIVRNEPFVPPKPLPAIVDTLEGSVPLLEVTTGCRWPVTPGPPHRFCNRAPMDNKPYCGGHFSRAIQPREKQLGKTCASLQRSQEVAARNG